jgi:hypothetical protein
MRADAAPAFADALRAVPEGYSTGTAHGMRYRATRQSFNGGRSVKLVAEAVDGSDYISLNFYDLRNGPQLAPCEMAHEKVIAFVRSYRPEAEQCL